MVRVVGGAARQRREGGVAVVACCAHNEPLDCEKVCRVGVVADEEEAAPGLWWVLKHRPRRRRAGV